MIRFNVAIVFIWIRCADLSFVPKTKPIFEIKHGGHSRLNERNPRNSQIIIHVHYDFNVWLIPWYTIATMRARNFWMKPKCNIFFMIKMSFFLYFFWFFHVWFIKMMSLQGLPILIITYRNLLLAHSFHSNNNKIDEQWHYHNPNYFIQMMWWGFCHSNFEFPNSFRFEWLLLVKDFYICCLNWIDSCYFDFLAKFWYSLRDSPKPNGRNEFQK